MIPIQLIVFILFSQENSDGNGKSFLPFQVRSNDAVPKRKILQPAGYQLILTDDLYALFVASKFFKVIFGKPEKDVLIHCTSQKPINIRNKSFQLPE